MANLDEIAHLEALRNLELADRLARRPRRRFYPRRDPFECLSEDLFIKVFRLSKDVTRHLIVMLDPFLEAPSRNSALPKQIKVLVALNFYASGSYQTSVGQNLYFGISQSSASRCIREVTNALNEGQIFNQWVKFPQTLPELRNVRHEFYNSFGFPGIIGCIDCTHVAIYPPPRHDPLYPEHIYINRKNYHSINVQLVCDAKMKIINVNAKYPGSCHDCHIWNNSRVQDAVIHLSNVHPDFFLIGDSGYPLRPWLLTPLQNPLPNTPEFEYDKAFKKARCTIERCNGLLKMRFRCLLKHRVLHYAPNVCSKIINACVVLHNICLESNIPNLDVNNGIEDLGMYEPMQLIDNNYDGGNNRQNADLIRGRNTQRNIIRNYFT